MALLMRKAKSAFSKRYNLSGNPNIDVELHNIRLERENVTDLFKQYDIIADGSDNFETRYPINDAAYFNKNHWYLRHFPLPGTGNDI